MSGALILLLICFLSQGTLCDEWASVPRTIEVFSGSCVTIPCSFVTSQYYLYLHQACAGIWRDSNHNDVFDSRNPQTSKINGALTGSLTQKDCTTTLYNMQADNSATYYFRIDCGNVLKWNFQNQPVQIVVRGGHPPRPTLHINKQVVKEGASVSVTCSVAAPCQAHPPTLTWTPGLGATQETLEMFLKTSALIFNATSAHHRKSISCTATYDQQAGGFVLSNNLTLEVLYAPKHTEVTFSPSGPVPEGSNMTLTCSSEANPAVTEYIWFRDDGAQKRTIGKGPIINIQTCKIHSSVTCKATNACGSQYAKISPIQFQSAPQISSSSRCIKHGDQVSCSCEAEGVPAPGLLWLLDGFPVNHSDEFAISHESLSDASVRSNITVNQPKERNLSTLVCRTTNSLATASQGFYGLILEALKSDCQGQVPLSVYICIAVLTAAFVCSLLFALRAQCCRSIKGQSAGNTDPFANSYQMPNRTEEDIYMNSKGPQGPRPQPEPITEASSPQEDDSVLYSSVIWKPRAKKKKEGEEEEDCRNPSGCSYLEEERCMLGSMKRNSMINSLPVDCLYAQVKFKDKNVAQK